MNLKKRSFSIFFKFAYIILLVFIVYRKAPDIINHFKHQGLTLNEFKVEMLDGKIIDTSNLEKPLVIVFWATWCGPCQIELDRINSLIKNQKIGAHSILAISIQEEKDVVQKETVSKDYQFQIGIDPEGRIAELFKVNGTPTVIFVDRNNKIDWMTTGLSPTLEFRLEKFLK